MVEVGPEDVAGGLTAGTFRTSWHFDSGQALAWAVLGFQADCAEKVTLILSSVPFPFRLNVMLQLYILSESVYSGQSDSNIKGGSKHIRSDNAIASLLIDIQLNPIPNVQAFRLQTWAFMRLTVIPHDNSTSSPSIALRSRTSMTHNSTFSLPTSRIDDAWDQIWTQTIRRISVSTVCRTASHLAHVLLTHASSFLPPHRVLAEI